MQNEEQEYSSLFLLRIYIIGSDEFRRPIQEILHKNDDQLEAYKMNGLNC